MFLPYTGYYEQLCPWSFVIAIIDECKLINCDYKSLVDGGQLSQSIMNYITTFLLPPRFKNLSKFSDVVINGSSLHFSITNKICFMPFFVESSWILLIFDTENSTYCCINDTSNAPDFACFFKKFIEKYNEDSHKVKLKNFQYWKEVEFQSSVLVSTYCTV